MCVAVAIINPSGSGKASLPLCRRYDNVSIDRLAKKAGSPKQAPRDDNDSPFIGTAMVEDFAARAKHTIAAAAERSTLMLTEGGKHEQRH
jgi:hypothetical protein